MIQKRRNYSGKITLETSGEDAKYTRNEWGRCKHTLKTSGEDVNLHSFLGRLFRSWPVQLPNMVFLSTRFECIFLTLSTRFVCSFHIFSTRFECSFPIFSTRFEFIFLIFSTRFECSFHIFSTRSECSFRRRKDAYFLQYKIHCWRNNFQIWISRWKTHSKRVYKI